MWADGIMSWNARGEQVIDTAARRISFDETRCQGESVRQRSMKISISAILEPKAKETSVSTGCSKSSSSDQ